MTVATSCLQYPNRFGYFVLKQPRRLDYADEGGPTDNCSPEMSQGRGPYRYQNVH